MRDRKKQRLLRKTKEKGLSRKDESGLPDPTPYEAVQRIIKKEREALDALLPQEKEKTPDSESKQQS